MDQRQAFANIQTSLNLGNTSDRNLGGLVIISALFTEFALAEILLAEAEKIDTAADMADVTAAELAEIDNSVARVLDQVSRIEKRVVEKIDRGIELRNCEEVA